MPKTSPLVQVFFFGILGVELLHMVLRQIGGRPDVGQLILKGAVRLYPSDLVRIVVHLFHRSHLTAPFPTRWLGGREIVVGSRRSTSTAHRLR